MADIHIINGNKNLLSFVQAENVNLKQLINENGVVLLRGFKIHSSSEFQKISESICDTLFEYKYGSTPRTKIGGNIYTSTEYPSTHTIPLHNENSYTNKWPSKILFYCAVEPKIGGETPIANSHLIFNAIDENIRNKFIKYGVMYVRNYGMGMDLPWQQAFQSEEKKDVEYFCEQNGIEYQWIEGDKLRTKQTCQAAIKHPLHGFDVWFNQAHLFHESANSEELKQYFNDINSMSLPRNAFYGNGEAIEVEQLSHIRDAYKSNEISFQWKKGDLMILDNHLYCHARNPFEGERRILVSMGE